MSYVTPQQLEDKRLLADTISDVINALEWFQSNLPDPLIDSQLGSLRFVRDRMIADIKIAEQFCAPLASIPLRNEG